MMQHDEKDSILIYKGWYDYLVRKKSFAVLIKAILEYGFYGTPVDEMNLKDDQILFLKCSILPLIDSNKKRYEDACKGASFGKLGGRPRKTLGVSKPATPNDNVNVKGDVKAKNNDYDYENADGIVDGGVEGGVEGGVDSHSHNHSQAINAGREEKIEEQNEPAICHSADSVSGWLNEINHNQSLRADVTYFLPVFFFRNFKSPMKEAEKFISYYSTLQWTTSTGNYLGTNEQRVAKALTWRPEDQSERFSESFLLFWKQLFNAAPVEVKSAMMADSIRFDINRKENIAQLVCPNIVRLWMESNQVRDSGILKNSLMKYFNTSMLKYFVLDKKPD